MNEMEINQAKAALMTMFGGYSIPAADRDFKLEAYWEILRELPPACVTQACRQISRGSIATSGYLPSCPEIYQAALKIRDANLPPQRRYPLLPPASDKNNPETRKRVAKMFSELVKELKAGGKIIGAKLGAEGKPEGPIAERDTGDRNAEQ